MQRPSRRIGESVVPSASTRSMAPLPSKSRPKGIAPKWRKLASGTDRVPIAPPRPVAALSPHAGRCGNRAGDIGRPLAAAPSIASARGLALHGKAIIAVQKPVAGPSSAAQEGQGRHAPSFRHRADPFALPPHSPAGDVARRSCDRCAERSIQLPGSGVVVAAKKAHPPLASPKSHLYRLRPAQRDRPAKPPTVGE